MTEAETKINTSKFIYYVDESQKLNLEKFVNASLSKLQTLFQKEEILKFLYKYVLEGKIDFKEEIKSEGKEVTEEEIKLKQDKFCRDLKIIFDQIKPNIYTKYNNRIGRAAIKIMKCIYNRKQTISCPIRDVKITSKEDYCEENQKKYEKLDSLKPVMEETIYISNAYTSEYNKANGFLSQNLDEFYNDERYYIIFVNMINGEEKMAKDDDLIDKVVTQKEKTGTDFIFENKKFINEQIEEQNKLDTKLENMINEIKNLKQQKEEFDKYCNENSIFKEINEVDFYS